MAGVRSVPEAVCAAASLPVDPVFRLVGTGLLGFNTGLGTALVLALLTAAAARTREPGTPSAVARLWLGAVAAITAATGITGVTAITGLATPGRTGGLWGIVSLASVAIISVALWARPFDGGRPGAWAALGAAVAGWAGVAAGVFLTGYTGGGLAWAGVGLGLFTAAAVGAGCYAVATRLPTGVLTACAGGLLVAVTAGILAGGIGALQHAGRLPGGDAAAFDSRGWSGWWSDPGMLAQTVFQLTPAPTVLQFAGWLSYLIGAVSVAILTRRRATARR